MVAAFVIVAGLELIVVHILVSATINAMVVLDLVIWSVFNVQLTHFVD